MQYFVLLIYFSMTSTLYTSPETSTSICKYYIYRLDTVFEVSTSNRTTAETV